MIDFLIKFLRKKKLCIVELNSKELHRRKLSSIQLCLTNFPKPCSYYTKKCSNRNSFHFLTGFHHFGIPGHLTAGHEWRTLTNRPGFPPGPFFHQQPPHFPPHMLALDRDRTVGLPLTNRK